MKQVFLVFIGGGFGSVLRYLVSRWLNKADYNIPYGTFFVNVLGSLLIGIILGYAMKSSSLTQNQTLLLATGFCGGFTTFSAFAYENQALLKSGDYLNLGIYLISSVVLGLLAVLFGLYISRFL